MRISNINFVLPFKKLSPNKPAINLSNIQVTEAKTNSRWFYDNCTNPPSQNKIYADEYKPKTSQEYFIIGYDKNKNEIKTPVRDIHETQDGKTVVAIDGKLQNFSGVSYKKNNGEIIQEIHFLKGYPITVTDYKNGQEYKLTRYSQHTHKINQIYYYDGSFDISQKSNPSEVSICIQDINKFGEKTAIQISAAKQKGIGKIQCEFPNDYGYKTLYLEWSYPNINYSFSGNVEDAKDLKNALTHLSEVINSDEYKENFGNNSCVQSQVVNAIEFLDNIN